MSQSSNLDKLQPYGDPRIQLRSAHLNGSTYGYLYGTPPSGTPSRGTIVLIHGFPDISFGWRYQIPMLLSLGLTVIAPDCIGYGRSDSPGSENLSMYSHKRISDDMAELCRQQGITKVILGGHDWGGAIVYRIALYYPDLVFAVFSVCTPYFPPNPNYEPLGITVQKRLPNFGYQMQFASGEVEKKVQSEADIRTFLNALYGGAGQNRETGWDAEQGVLFSNLALLHPTPLLEPHEMDYYVAEFARHGLNGPLNWYRNREVNYMDEWAHFFASGKHARREVQKLEQEILFVLATKDAALTPALAQKMGDRIPRLTRAEVESGHWALWQKPAEINQIVKSWLEDKVLVAVTERVRKSKL